MACGVSRRFGLLKKDVVITHEVTATEPLIEWVENNIIQKPLLLFERQEVIRVLSAVLSEGFMTKEYFQKIFTREIS